jgi:acid phosphatase
MMENTSLATIGLAITAGTAPNILAMKQAYASGADYHGVTHPSLPNYIALTSGDNQGIGCDCHAAPGSGSCNAFTCNLLLGACSCNNGATHLGDQLEAAGKTWMDYGEDMGAPCNLTDAGNYAVRHLPFLYYDNVQSNAARCKAHVVDLSAYNPGSPAHFQMIAPNLVNDMHDPNLPSDNTAVMTNIPHGDAWLGPRVATITGSQPYKQGGLLVVVWDEDDDSGGITGTDDPIGIFVMSPFAKSGGFVSQTKADHYALLATIEDGLGLPRLGKAAAAQPLSDYFPAN